MVAYVYTSNFTLDWPGHVFPVEKYGLIHARLGEKTVEPEPATDEQLLLVHTKRYLGVLDKMTSNPEIGYMMFEVPCTRNTVDAFRLGAGASVLAGRKALEEGAAGCIGGGFHHAFADHGEGFCLINDLAVAVRVLQDEGLVKKAAVIDCDVHQGNGTAHIFEEDESVHTFSIHQEHNYPVKMRSSLDIGLPDLAGDEEYLARLGGAVPKILDDFRPDIVVYQAGADPFEGDVLGGLRLTKEGLAARDRLVYGEAKKRGIPVAATLGGGYAHRTEDVVDIHTATLKLLKEMFGP
ncbi:MAG: histone deacetylase family protein [Planctomycetota bacterium]|jgi:acetoin utilization deacetylase AcuC-like enzyme